VGDTDLRGLLRRVTELAHDGIPAADAVSVVLGRPDDPELLASSSQVAQAGDGVQQLAGAGPIFDAFRAGRTVGTADLLADPAWPQLGRAGLGRPGGPQPVRSCVAIPLTLDGACAGVLALYTLEVRDLTAAIEQARPYVVAAQTLVRDSRLV